MAKRTNSSRYTTYVWTEADPVLNIVASLRKVRGLSLKEVHEASGGKGKGVARETIRSWESGKTKRPRFETVAAAAAAMGADNLPITPLARRLFKESLK